MMLLILLLIGSSYASIRVDQFELNQSPIYYSTQKQIELPATYIKNDINAMWVEPPEVIESPSLYIGAQKQIELSATNVENNLPSMLVEPPVVPDSPLYIGGQKRIELSANFKSNPSFGLWVPPTETTTITSVPLYVNSLKEIELAVVNLKDNLLSMSGAIPYLHDPRRDFAEIINVIYGIAKEIAQSCVLFDYDKSYQRRINTYAPNGIRKPQTVINDVQFGLAKFNSWTKSIQTLIRSVCPDHSHPRQCDYVIHSIVVSKPEKYHTAAKIFFVGSKAAHAFNQRIKEFSAVSNCHDAHRFIIEAPWKIKSIIHELANVIRIMTPLRNHC